MYVNLMSATFQKRQLLRARLRQWSVVLAAAGVVALALTCQIYAHRRETRKQLDSLQVRFRPILQLEQEIEALKHEQQELERHEHITLSLADEKPMLSLLGLVATATHDGQRQTYVQYFDFRQKTAGDGENSHRFVLELTGIGQDNLAVARLAAILRDAGLFQRVQVTSTEATDVGDGMARRFQLECAF